MRITLTKAALEQLQKSSDGRSGTFRLVYDTDGCGCAVNGVPMLWYVDEPAPGDVVIESDSPVKFSVDAMQAIFFEDSLKLDFRPETGGLRLYSDSQIYNASIRVQDRTASAAN